MEFSTNKREKYLSYQLNIKKNGIVQREGLHLEDPFGAIESFERCCCHYYGPFASPANSQERECSRRLAPEAVLPNAGAKSAQWFR